MPYCTKADLIQRFGQREIDDLLDRDNNSAEDSNTLAATIADADALIDGYIGSRYSVPLASVPALVVGLSCNITRFMLWDDNAPDEVRKRYDDSISQLKDVARGLLTLPAAVTPSETNPTGGVDYEAEERVFTMSTLSGF